MKLDNFIRKLEREYAEEKAKEAEGLHNAIALVLAEHKAEIQTVLYVLEMVKFEVLRERYKALFSPREGLKPGPIRAVKPEEKE
ncbi:MAG: hypothetical protein PHU08_05125 [Dehalococcoidales bacterium]|nr:hypothetical protein [Dehalococcoidales bacterium]